MAAVTSPTSPPLPPPYHSGVLARRQPQLSAFGRPRGVTRATQTASWLRDYLTAIKHGSWHPFTPMERRVREATRNQPWGPTGALLNELAEASFNYADCRIIFAVLEFRLGYPAAKWRNVYKALTVLEFVLKRGSDAAVSTAREDLLFRLEDLSRNFDYLGNDGRDHGINVRHRAGAIFALMKDEAALDAERQAIEAKRRTALGVAHAVQSGFYGAGGSPPRGGFFHDPNASQSPQAAPDGQRAAGETKGVTLEENRRHLAALREMLTDPANKLCADCRQGRSSWASINCGVFVCLVCAGVHRGLGVHVSKVRSCSLDTWLPEQVAFMAATGNATAAAFWEARLAPTQRPAQGDPAALERFVRSKYEQRLWALGDWPPPAALAGPEPEEQELVPEEVEEAEAAPEPQPPSPQPEPDAAERLRAARAQVASQAGKRRPLPPNVMDIDAAWDADPLAWAGATVITHYDDPFAEGATAASDGTAHAAPGRPESQLQQRVQAPTPPALPPQTLQGRASQPQPQAQPLPPLQRREQTPPGTLLPPPASPAPAATATQAQQPAAQQPASHQPRQQTQRPQPASQQPPPRPQPPPRIAAPSVMDAPPPRRPRPAGPAQDPFQTAALQQHAQQQPRSSTAAQQHAQQPAAGADGGRRHMDAAAVAHARSALAYQQEEMLSSPRPGGVPTAITSLSVAQAALDRLARARAVSTEPVLPAVPAAPLQQAQRPAQQRQTQQPSAAAQQQAREAARQWHGPQAQPNQAPAPPQQAQQRDPAPVFSPAPVPFGPAPAPQVYTSRFSTQRPRRPYNPLATSPAAALAPAAAPDGAQTPATQQNGSAPVTSSFSAAAAAAPQQQQHATNGYQQQPAANGFRHPQQAQQQQQPAVAGFRGVAAPQAARPPPPPEPTAIDAIGSGGLGFRAPIAPRVSPLEGMRRQMSAGVARAAAQTLHRTTPIKAIKGAGSAAVTVHSDATGRNGMAPPHGRAQRA